MDNAIETPKDINTIRTERLKQFRFTSSNQPAKRGRHKGSSPTDWLRKLSRTKIDFQNPLTGKVDKAPISLVVAIQLILKATQDSDLPSIKEYFERIDGKVAQKIIDEGLGDTRIIIIRDGNKTETLAGQVHLQQEALPGPVERLGDRQDTGLNLAGNVIQRGNTQ